MLYRTNSLMKIATAFVLAMAFLGGVAVGQLRPQMNGPEENQPPKPQRKKEKGPRALGVLEITANGKARLIPITILVGDKWFDAGLYMATPRPMALEPETVYEGFAAGESQGLFTVTAAQEVGENWYGLGKWKPKGVEIAKKPKLETPPPSPDDERPVLKRSKPASSQSDTTQAKAQPTPAPAPAPKQTAPATPAPAPDKKTTEAAAAPAPKQSDDVPNRPVLRRGAPGVEQAEGISVSSAGDFAGPTTAKNASAKPVATASAVTKTLAAISDEGGPEPRSYAFFVQPGEREDYMVKITRIASESLQKFISSRFKGAMAPAVTEANSRLEIFDLTTSNSPVLVLTAKVPASAATMTATKRAPVAKRASQPAAPVAAPVPSALEYYVTVVARVNYDGDLRKVFDSVTDSTRLDAYPKMDLIDAVDANGDGAGELLFRETYDRSRAYVVYRVGMDQLWPLFEGAQR